MSVFFTAIAWSIVIPFTHSVTSEDEAITEPQPNVLNFASWMMPSSLVTEWVKGMSIDKAAELKNSQIAEELNLPPVKIHCSVLAEDAIKAAIADYRAKHEKSHG